MLTLQSARFLGTPPLTLRDFHTGFPRAAMAVTSREICSTNYSAYPSSVNSINASCKRADKSASANSLNARENVDVLGTSYNRSQPHRRRSVESEQIRFGWDFLRFAGAV